mgnify:CR=1 FL=1
MEAQSHFKTPKWTPLGTQSPPKRTTMPPLDLQNDHQGFKNSVFSRLNGHGLVGSRASVKNKTFSKRALDTQMSMALAIERIALATAGDRNHDNLQENEFEN